MTRVQSQRRLAYVAWVAVCLIWGNPVIAVLLGVALLGEQIDARMAVAAVLVFAGVAIVRCGAPASAVHQVLPAAERPLDARAQAPKPGVR